MIVNIKADVILTEEEHETLLHARCILERILDEIEDTIGTMNYNDLLDAVVPNSPIITLL